jgi:hypothetical protein
MTLQLLHSEFPYTYVYEENLIFFFIGADTAVHRIILHIHVHSSSHGNSYMQHTDASSRGQNIHPRHKVQGHVDKGHIVTSPMRICERLNG